LVGHQDPECRQPFPWDESKWDNNLRNYVKALAALRGLHKALRWGTYEPVYSREGVYAFLRRSDDETLLIALNASEEARTIEIKLPGAGRGKKKILFGQAIIETKGDVVQPTIAGRSAIVVKVS
jgi:alpha-glucosidase